MRLFILCLFALNCARSEPQANLTKVNQYLKDVLTKPGTLQALHQLGVEYFKHASIFNTTVDFTIPLFSFNLPSKENPNDSTAIIRQNLVGQSIFLVVVVLCFVASLALPIALNKLHDTNMEERTFHFITEDNVCLLRAICEAHRDYNKFGWWSLPLLYLLFGGNSASPSPMYHAAYFGANGSRECGRNYKCPYSSLKVLQYLITVFRRYFIT